MRYLAIGDPLVEFTAQHDAPSTFNRRAGGDTLNTAIYLSRLTPSQQVGYLSCLGDDGQSAWLQQAIEAEGIDTSCLATQQNARVGLSFITTDDNGERSFSYWREQSPFRHYFNSADNLQHLDKASTIIFSAVTLAVLMPQGRTNLLQKLEVLKNQGKNIIFDTNYRPILWENAEIARENIIKAARLSSVLLPSSDDLAACFGISDPAKAMHELMAFSDTEIVQTTGGGSVYYRARHSDKIEQYNLPPAVKAVDTTGAGDSFNAGYLVARDQGLDVETAINKAAKLAAIVVGYSGAIIPESAMPAR